IYGDKRSGKGTIAKVMQAILGAGNYSSPSIGDLAERFGKAQLIGKRAAFFSDMHVGNKSDRTNIVEWLKKISGDDSVSIERKFRDGAWEGHLNLLIVMFSNELPGLEDASGALASRLVVLTMTESFYGREDKQLFTKLVPELSAIFNWALDGYDR